MSETTSLLLTYLLQEQQLTQSHTVLVQGPYLVRGAEIDDSIVAITGDADSAAQIEVFADKHVKTISWNNKTLPTTSTTYGSLIASLNAPPTFTAPILNSWKVQDSLPERFANYSTTGPAWVTANHTTSPSFYPPETYPSLYIDEYGIHTGYTLFRGTFSGPASGVYLSIQGGSAFGWSAFLNGELIGSFLGSPSESSGNLTLTFRNSTSLLSSSENILLILSDNSGHDQRAGALNPRGIINATLLAPNTTSKTNTTFTNWSIAGPAKDPTTALPLDPLRGPLNEGGLLCERLGWHLPSYPESQLSTWPSASSISFTGAGVRFYRTSFPLDVPAGLDVGLSFRLGTPSNSNSTSSTATTTNAFRTLLYINGYQYGRYNPHIGHQISFPVPPGILDYNGGDNVLGLAVWAQTENGAEIEVDVVVDWVVESGFAMGETGYLRDGDGVWDKRREAYR